MTDPETLFNGRWLRVRRRGTWEYAERTNASGGAVIIVAVTPDDEVLFVEQFRVPIQQRTIEMPAGLIGDEPGREQEDAVATAARELEEETGYRAARIELVMSGPTSAGMSTEHATFARASGLVRVGDGGGDDDEQIVVHRVPRATCAEWLAARMREGYSIDPKLYAGLYFLERDAAGKPWSEP
jgi:ADP-ribose pyrophosphatase